MVYAVIGVVVLAALCFIMGMLALRHVHEMERSAVLERKGWKLADYEISARKYFIFGAALLVVGAELLLLI